MRCVIFSGGPINDYSTVSVEPGDMIICADSGACHALLMGITPDLVVGDMDSLDPGDLRSLEEKGSRTEIFPAAKNEVDTELAIDEAIRSGASEIIIYGAVGGRLDHTLANIQLLARPARDGIKAFIRGDDFAVTAVTPKMPGEVIGQGCTFSLLPLTSRVTGVTTRGALWELNGAEFVLGKPYGVSNIINGESVSVTIEQGLLLLIGIGGALPV